MKKILGVLIILLGVTVIAFLMKVNSEQGGRKNTVTLKIEEVTGEIKSLADSLPKNVDDESVKEVISFAKEKSSEGALSSKDGVERVLDEAKDKFGVEITASQKEGIAEAVEKLEGMGFSTEVLIDKAEETYQKYGEKFTDHLEEAFVEAAKEAAGESAKKMWDGVKDTVSDAVENLF